MDRIVSTEEELDALPPRTVILDKIERAFQRWNLAGWQKSGPSIAAHEPRLPARVLFDPRATTDADEPVAA